MSELSDLNSAITALESAVNSGVASISVDGQTTTFASMADMRARLAELQRMKESLLGLDKRKPRVSSVNMSRGV